MDRTESSGENLESNLKFKRILKWGIWLQSKPKTIRKKIISIWGVFLSMKAFGCTKSVPLERLERAFDNESPLLIPLNYLMIKATLC